MFSMEKVERIIPTLISTRIEIKKGDHDLGLHRLGTHVLENKIGTIRSLVSQNESFDKLIKIAVKHDLIKTLSKTNDEIKRTRLNQGGVRISLGTIDIDFGGNALTVANLLLSELGYIEDDPLDIDMEFLKEKLENFTQTCPYVLKINYSSTKSAKIVNRYYSLPKTCDFVPLTTINHIWTREEIDIVDNCLYFGTENQIPQILAISGLNSYNPVLAHAASIFLLVAAFLNASSTLSISICFF